MGNKEPKPEKQRTFWLEIGNRRINCTPENTSAYLYQDPTFDHIFHTLNLDEHGNRNGFYIFRPMLGDQGFDNLVRHMINNDFEVESLNEPDANDRQIYVSKYGEPCKPIEPVELTPRQDEYCRNMGRFLQEITVTAEDFQ